MAFYMSDLDYYNCEKMKTWLVDKERQQVLPEDGADHNSEVDAQGRVL